MAAEFLIWRNLTKIFRENEQLLHNIKPLEELGNTVRNVERAMAALEERNALDALDEDDPMYNRIRNLVALLYQADDLLDKSLFLLKKDGYPRAADGVSLFFSSHNPLLFPLMMGRDVRRVTQQIEDLAIQMLDSFDHITDSQRESVYDQEFKLVENTIIGRDSHKNDLIKMLLQPKADSKTNVSVIPIVGSPGVGKTTLAKYVYDDEKVRNHFDLKIWIQVSNSTDEAKIVQEIVEACTNRKTNDNRKANISHSKYFDVFGCRSVRSATPRDSTSKNKIDISENARNNLIDISERRLLREIKGKLFLLILDDASIKCLPYLKNLLAKGARGSHILLTTMSTDDANYSSTDSTHVRLNGLDEEHSWSLFKRFAFPKEDPREPRLENIGKLITKNCNGVPLTIKVTASLLHGKNLDYWVSINENMLGVEPKDIENHILQLSYDVLPTHLKVCFAYCSLFPEDYNFNKHDLISLWTAQGYINQTQGQSSEKTAENYLFELSRRCFFEVVRTDALENIVCCKMHPIVRSLACEQVAGSVMYVANSTVKQVTDSSCRHISYNCKNSSMKVLPSLVHAENLRTLLSVKEPGCKAKIDGSVCEKLISSFKHLRVLDLHNLGINTLPISIAKLIHLRYLDLSKNDLIILPNSVAELYYLQTLKLNSCIKLKKICGDFGQLVNLKRFEINECDSLKCMPRGLEKLFQLETLNRFVISKDCLRELEALKKLNSLRGRLVIELSGDWEITIPHSSQIDLREKNHLEELKIFWEQTVSEKTYYSHLLEQLKPNKDLKILCIEGYKGGDFPSWLQSNMLDYLPKLVVVSIEGCDKCKHLPPFSELQFLKRLTLRHMVNVQYVEPDSQDRGSQGSATTSSFFESLEELTLHNFYKLERWKKERVLISGREQNIQMFPKLTKLKLRNCPKLRSMPLFMKVLELNLINVNKTLLEECANTMPMATQQEINEPTIENMQIKGCNDLDSFRTVRMWLGDLSSLKQLVIDGCEELLSLALELEHLNSLEKLEISNCKKLDLSHEEITTASNTRNGTISWISSKIVRQQSEIPRSPWTSLQYLCHLILRDLPKIEALPEGLQHVQSLKTMWISACPALKALPEWIGSLTSLQHLRIDSCPGVESLPDGIKEIKSLVKVEITECPQLMKRCKVHTGEDWHKIKHAWIVLHKSWRYGLMSDQGASQKRSNASETTDVKYYIVAAEEISEI